MQRTADEAHVQLLTNKQLCWAAITQPFYLFRLLFFPHILALMIISSFLRVLKARQQYGEKLAGSTSASGGFKASTAAPLLIEGSARNSWSLSGVSRTMLLEGIGWKVAEVVGSV